MYSALFNFLHSYSGLSLMLARFTLFLIFLGLAMSRTSIPTLVFLSTSLCVCILLYLAICN
ncbi:hypothetical protein BJ912DRAFT_977504 [Pholiota molesta]|nr:hypothetical protein BJ912DRAFT_977504 [Pholiota molesta]